MMFCLIGTVTGPDEPAVAWATETATETGRTRTATANGRHRYHLRSVIRPPWAASDLGRGRTRGRLPRAHTGPNTAESDPLPSEYRTAGGQLIEARRGRPPEVALELAARARGRRRDRGRRERPLRWRARVRPGGRLTRSSRRESRRRTHRRSPSGRPGRRSPPGPRGAHRSPRGGRLRPRRRA